MAQSIGRVKSIAPVPADRAIVQPVGHKWKGLLHEIVEGPIVEVAGEGGKSSAQCVDWRCHCW